VGLVIGVNASLWGRWEAITLGLGGAVADRQAGQATVIGGLVMGPDGLQMVYNRSRGVSMDSIERTIGDWAGRRSIHQTFRSRSEHSVFIN
jgi:hypothetical protein